MKVFGGQMLIEDIVGKKKELGRDGVYIPENVSR